MKVTATFDDSLKLYINDILVRELTNPINHNSYKFRYNGEEYYFVYEQQFQRRTIWLYPIGDFKPNKVSI